jgi:hypothetical protein
MKTKLLRKLRKPFTVTFDKEIYTLYKRSNDSVYVYTYKKDEFSMLLCHIHYIMLNYNPLQKRHTKNGILKFKKQMNTNKILF